MNSRVIWRTHTTLVPPFKACGTSDILIHAVIQQLLGTMTAPGIKSIVLLFVLRLGLNIKS